MKTRYKIAGSMGLLALVAYLVTRSPVVQPVVLATCAAPHPIEDGFKIAAPEAAGIDSEKLCDLIKRAAAANINLHSIVVERHGSIVAEQYLPGVDHSIWSLRGYRQTFGPGDQHDMRSVSKSVVGLLVGIAVAQGKIKSVDVPVFDFYPALATYATAEKRNITLQHVLTMSTGLTWLEPVATYGTPFNDETRLFWDWHLPRVVLRRNAEAPAGQRYNYNGGNTALLADILEAQTGEKLAEFARKHLFEPLGIRAWTWVRDPWRRHISFAGLRITPRDMIKIGRLVRQRGEWDGKQIVPAEWVERALKSYVTTATGLGYGYQWYSGVVAWHGRDLPWHGAIGNGGQRIFVVPALQLTMVTTAGNYNSAAIGRAVTSLFSDVIALVQP